MYKELDAHLKQQAQEFGVGTRTEMSFRREKIPSQTPLPIVGSTFERVTLEPSVSLSFRNQNESLEHKAVLALLINVSMRDSSESGSQPVAIWKGGQESARILQPLIGEAVQNAFAHRRGHVEIKFYNGRTLFFEPEIDGEWGFYRVYRDKIIFRITWSDGTYISIDSFA